MKKNEQSQEARRKATPKKEELEWYAEKFRRLQWLLEHFEELGEFGQFSAICELKERCFQAAETFANVQGAWELIDKLYDPRCN